MWISTVLPACVIAVGTVLSAGAAVAAPRVTFNKDIAPIIHARCSSCHRPGEIGPFSLITYDDVKRRATQIAAITARRVMPPWKPVPGKGEFLDARALTEHEIGLIAAWVAGGTVEGDA